MPDTEQVLDLLAEWEEQRQQGKLLTPEELCPDDETLREALRVRIQKRQKVAALFDAGEATLPSAQSTQVTVPRLEGYDILDTLGRGGMGVVFKARQTRLNRLVAVKMILSGAGAGAHELDRFRAEAEAVARLHHPGIVQIFEVGEQDGQAYLVLEFVGGGSLAQLLGSQPLPPRRVAELGIALARAVQHAHEGGILHRDLKPANVLLTADGTPKIADFGLAKRLDIDQGYTQTGAVMGSPSYMAPEQAEGRVRDLGPATDLYALGAILYEMLTGRPPFVGSSILDTLEQVRHHDPAPPRFLHPAVPRDLELICLKCLEKSPRDRYASAAALARDLEHFLAGEPISVRGDTMFDQVSRAVKHTSVDVNFRTWGRAMLWVAPVPVLVHGAVYFLTRHLPAFPLYCMATSICTVFFLMFLIFGRNRDVMRQVIGYQRRHIRAVWLGHNIGFLLMPLVLWQAGMITEPRHWLLLYPLWMVLVGTTFFAIASEAGLLFIIGTIAFALALVAALHLEWAPLVAGLLMSSNITVQGFFLSRLGRGER